MAKDSNTLQYSPIGVYIFEALQSGFYSIESGEEADGSNGKESEECVAPVEDDGIGGNDIARGVTSTESDEAEVLLEEAKDDSKDEADNGSNAGDEPSFTGEDAANK